LTDPYPYLHRAVLIFKILFANITTTSIYPDFNIQLTWFRFVIVTTMSIQNITFTTACVQNVRSSTCTFLRREKKKNYFSVSTRGNMQVPKMSIQRKAVVKVVLKLHNHCSDNDKPISKDNPALFPAKRYNRPIFFFFSALQL